MKESTKDKVRGTAHQTTGKVKEKAGEWTKDRDLASEGRVEKTVGKIEKKIGKVKEKIE